jgi:fumarate reductase subunit C
MKTYRRPMAGWWYRNPYYLWYMLRELSCVLIVVYALTLLVGLYRLAQGEVAFEDWLGALSTPASIGFHGVAFVVVLYHAWTWFKVMPKTLPRVPFPDRAIVALGVGAAVACSIALLGALWWSSLWGVR